MASAYGTLATGGVHHPPVVITEVVDHQGKTIFKAKKKGKRIISKQVSWAATRILKGVISGGTATRARIGRPAAGKTGTSQENRDVWFVGYTPQLVTSVWVGYPKERTIYVNGSRAFGGTVAAPIWASFMKKALKGEPAKDFAHAGAPKYSPSKFHIPVSKPPKISGLTLEEAIKKLDGFSYTVDYAYSSKPKGTVIGQKVKGTKLTIIVSKGPKPVAPQPPGGSGNSTSTPGGETSGTPKP